MGEPAKYSVGTIFEMAAIPAEARPRFLAELPDMLNTIEALTQLHEAIALATGGQATVNPRTPVWIDDDKGEKTVTYHMPDGETFSRTSPIIKEA